MSSLTNLCLNRLDPDPYLHRLIPHITQHVRDYPDQHITVLTDKHLFANGLYLSLIEHRIPVNLYNAHHSIPLNLLDGNLPTVIRRLERLGLLTPASPQLLSDTMFNQMTYTMLTQGLTLVKAHKNNGATLEDLSELLNLSLNSKDLFLKELKQSQTISKEPELLDLLEWFLSQNTPSSVPNILYEYSALGRLNFYQFEAEWRSLFNTTHRPTDFFNTTVNIINVHHLSKVKESIVLYLLELLGNHSQKESAVSFFLDLAQPLSDDQWSELLLNNNLEVTQTLHTPKDNERLDSIYEIRSIKYFRHYSIIHKEQILKAIYEFKCPYQLRQEADQRKKNSVSYTTSPGATSKESVSSSENDNWWDRNESLMSLYDTVDFEKPNLI